MADDEFRAHGRGGDPPVLAPAARREPCSTRCSRTCATSPGPSTTPWPMRRSATRCASGSTSDAGQRLQPLLLPVDRAEVLPRHRRAARRARAEPHRRRRGADRHREAVRHRPRRGARAQPHRAARSSRSARSSASTTTSARRPSRTSSRSASRTTCSSRSGTATTSTRSRSRPPRTSASSPAPATTTRAGALRDLIQNHMLQLLCRVAMEPPVHFTGRRDARREGQGPAGDRAAARPTRSPTSRCAPSTGRGRSAASAVPGYLEEPGVPPDSTTETYAALRLQGRQLALGGRALLPAHRQAPGAQGHRDRGHAQARPAPRLPRRGLGRRAAQPAHPHHPARRGRVAVARGEDPRRRACASGR